jgi:lysophospholipase L1-like esterase
MMARTAPDARGERAFHRVLLLLFVAALACLATAALYLRLQAVPPRNVYFEMQRHAGYVYLALWASITAVGALTTLGRRTIVIGVWILALLFDEAGAQVWFTLVMSPSRRPYHPFPTAMLRRFEPDSLLVGIPRPGVYGEFTHDSLHHRVTVNTHKHTGARNVFVFGGSTTYDIALADRDTWPSQLSAALGDDFAVTNFGVPGYTSVEHVVQTRAALHAPHPACVVYYVGWNDLRLSHMDSLREDYSGFQRASQVVSLGVGHQPGFFENNMLVAYLVRTLITGDGHPPVARGAVSATIDQRVLRIFGGNMRRIADLARRDSVSAVFIPQVLNYAWYRTQGDSGDSRRAHWVPLVPLSAIERSMRIMNDTLAASAREGGATFVDAPLGVGWTSDDYADDGHFSASGARKFAESIVDAVRNVCSP